MRVTKIVTMAAGLLELGCIVGLAGIGLKCNNNWFNTQCALIEEEHNHMSTKIMSAAKDAKIKKLENELKELKTKYGITEEEV